MSNAHASPTAPLQANRLIPVPHTSVRFTNGFWSAWTARIRQTTIPTQYKRLEEEGFLEVLNVDEPPRPLVRPVNQYGLSMQMFFDSDFGKWIEAASYSLAIRPDAELEAQIEEIVDKLAAAQLPDGYLNTWFIRREPDKRWTNLRDWHEMYSMGHLLEGAVAYFEATGKRRFLDIMIRCVDHIGETFGTGPGQRRGYDAHEEIELALVKLYRVTSDPRHLALAQYFIDERGRPPIYFDTEARARGADPADFWFKTHEYSQSHLPVGEQEKVVGHAVRAMYLYGAMADLAAETHDPTLKQALDRLWHHLTTRQLYVTGGMGSAGTNEGFTREFDLPNETAYAETCAAVALAFWAHRMAQIDLDGRFTDIMELALYNGVLSGIALDGEHYFYENPLESHGQHRRWRWHYCPCCPTNVARLVASLGQYVCSTGDDRVAVHLYTASTVDLRLGDRTITIAQETGYPWHGQVRLELTVDAPARFTLALRIPGWCRDARIEVNGTEVDLSAAVHKGYAQLDRVWCTGDAIQLAFAMPVERLYAHPNISMDADRVALRRGPIVYCVEETDVGRPPQHLRLPRTARFTCTFEPQLLDGAVVLRSTGTATTVPEWADTLYRTEPPNEEEVEITAVPYHLWANRTPGAMTVWLCEKP
jgi:uncharacterized protein